MPDIFDRVAQQSSQEKTPQGDIFDRLSQESTPTTKWRDRHLREIARVGSRAAETILGLPSDVLQVAGLGAKGLEKGASKIRESIGLQPLKTQEKKPGLPGSSELKGLSQHLFGDIVTPQSKTEEFLDDIVSDATALSLPVKGRLPFAKSLGTAIAANLASEGVKGLGVDKGGQVATKLGTFLLAGMAGRGTVKKFWNQQYKLAEEVVPKHAVLDASELQAKLEKLGDELKQGGIETPSQRFVEKPLNDLKKTIFDGDLLVKDAVAAKKKINELRSSLFDEVKGEVARKGARTKINEIANFLDESLENYGKQSPQFYKHYQAANEAYAGFQQSKRVGNWIKRVLPLNNVSKGGLLILEAIFKPGTLPLTAGTYGAFKGTELVTRMLKNKTLRKYYGNLLKDGIKENKAGFLKNLKEMEKEINKNDPDLFDELAGK